MLAEACIYQMWQLVFIPLALSDCIEYEKNNPEFYCDDLILWDVSNNVWDARWERNKEAYRLYYDLKTRYELDEDKSPDLECLAIAREFYCAYQFPYCHDTEEERGICDFLCELWDSRCPDEEYDQFCKNSESQKCSWGGLVGISWIVAVMSLMI